MLSEPKIRPEDDVAALCYDVTTVLLLWFLYIVPGNKKTISKLIQYFYDLMFFYCIIPSCFMPFFSLFKTLISSYYNRFLLIFLLLKKLLFSMI